MSLLLDTQSISELPRETDATVCHSDRDLYGGSQGLDEDFSFITFLLSFDL